MVFFLQMLWFQLSGQTSRPQCAQKRSDGSSYGESEGESHGDLALAEKRPDVGEPSKWAVLLHNDDYTTMEFVIEVLGRFFQKNHEQSVAIMLKIHQEGKGIAGIFGYEIAETKAVKVVDHARSAGFPLRCTVEKVDSGSGEGRKR